MRKYLSALSFVGAIALAGCATTSTPTSTADIITAVQNDAVLACKFLPTAATVAEIVSSAVPGAANATTMASQLAAQICAAVTAAVPTSGARRRSAIAPMVNGVVIHGRWVK